MEIRIARHREKRSGLLAKAPWVGNRRHKILFATKSKRRCIYFANMIELEVYAAGVRSLEKILELDHEFETVPGLRYKVDSNHDIVYLEFDEPTFTIQEIRGIFRKLGLEARIVGSIPSDLNPKSKTQLIHRPV
jgi:hypothetical protein